jgi:mono/diheme cytochrome c family protein
MPKRRALLAVLVAATACHSASNPSTVPSASLDPEVEPQSTVEGRPDPVDAALIERGAYVVAVAGCATCHTPISAAGAPDKAKLFAGGFEAPGPGGKGVWRAPNITPDPTTGIGSWTDDQVIAAIQTGARPEGGQLAPIMPYPFYARMTDADVHAVVAFLRAQNPVTHRVPRSQGLEMATPTEPAPTAAGGDPAGDPRGHGEYLVTLMHCAACHTPTEGAHKGKAFAGGNPFDNPLASGGGTIYAANITADPETGIGTWTEADLMRAVREMKRPDGDALRGPMTMYHAAWSTLSDRDARAIAVYLKSVPAVENQILHAQRKPRLNKVAGAGTSTP